MQKQPLNKDVRTENKTEVILPEDILTLKKFFAQRNIPLCQAENDCFRSPDIKNSSLRIALIAEPRLHECLQYEGHIIPLTPENYTAQLRYGKPDLLLIESFWRDSLNAWPLAFTAASPLHQTLRHLLLLAGEQGIPRAFWLTKDSSYQPLYRDILPYFDALFHADPQAGPLLAQEGFTSRELLPCIQPALHNPCQTPTHAKEEKYPLVLDGARDLMKIPALAKLFKQLEKQKAVCMESRDYIQGSEADILRERYLQHSNTYLGSVDAQGRLAILKKAQACLMTSFSSESSTSLMWKALEQAGIRVPTLFYGPPLSIHLLKIFLFRAQQKKMSRLHFLPCRRNIFIESVKLKKHGGRHISSTPVLIACKQSASISVLRTTGVNIPGSVFSARSHGLKTFTMFSRSLSGKPGQTRSLFLCATDSVRQKLKTRNKKIFVSFPCQEICLPMPY